MERQSFGIAAAAVAALAAGGAAQAVVVLGNGESIGVTELFAAGSDRKVQIDDKIFTFKSLRSATIMPNHMQVRGYVAASSSRAPGRSVGFDLIGLIGDFTPGNGRMAELNLQYTVEVDPAAYAADWRIFDTGLSFDGIASGPGSFSRVDETVIDLDTNRFLGNLSSYWIAGSPPTVRLSDAADYRSVPGGQHGFRALEVNKDLKFLAATAASSASASFVRQEFSQMTAPAPGALAVACLSGLLGARRRRGND